MYLRVHVKRVMPLHVEGIGLAAALAGTGAKGGACDTHTPAIHCQEALSVIDSVAAADTLNGFRCSRPRRTALVLFILSAAKPTDHEL